MAEQQSAGNYLDEGLQMEGNNDNGWPPQTGQPRRTWGE